MWEYRTEKLVSPGVDHESCIARLNELGRHGWEMVGSTFSSDGLYRMFFKRPMTNDSEQPYR